MTVYASSDDFLTTARRLLRRSLPRGLYEREAIIEQEAEGLAEQLAGLASERIEMTRDVVLVCARVEEEA